MTPRPFSPRPLPAGLEGLTDLALDMRWNSRPRRRPALDASGPGDLGTNLEPVSDLAAGCRRPAWPKRRRTRRSGGTGRRPGSPPAGAGSARLVCGAARRRGPARHRLLQPGVRAGRVAADLRGRPGHPRGGPRQNGERPGRAARRPSASCMTGATSGSSSPPTAGNWRPTRTTTRRPCRSRRCRDGTAAGCASPCRCRGGPLTLRVWQAQVGRVTLYLLDSNDPLNSPWDRAVTSQPLFRRPGAPPGSGAGPGRRRLARSGGARHRGRRVPPERGPCGLCGPGAGRALSEAARRLASRRRSGRPARATSSPPTPPSPPALTGLTPRLVGHYLQPFARRSQPARRRDPDAGAGCALRPVQHGLAGRARQRAHQRRQRAARGGQPRRLHAHLPALAGGRGADWSRHQRRPYAVLGVRAGARPLGEDAWMRPT